MRSTVAAFAALTSLACGAARPSIELAPPPPPRPTTAVAGALDPAWTVAACPSGQVEHVRDDGDTGYFLVGPGRAARDGRGITRAADVAVDDLMSATRVGERWIFDAYHGALYGADSFLGSLTPMGWIPTGTGHLSMSGDTMLVRTEDGNFYRLDLVHDTLVPLPLPAGRVAADAVVVAPSTVLLLLEPGDVVVSHDDGTTWTTLHPAESIVSLAVEDGRACLYASSGIRLMLGEADMLTVWPVPEADPEAAAEMRDDQAAESSGVAEQNDEQLWYDDPYCGEGDLPLAVTTAWGDGPPPRTFEDLELPSSCRSIPAASFVVAVCEPRHLDPQQGREVRVLDPSDGSLRRIPGLPRAVAGEALEVIDAHGSDTFVLRTGTRSLPRYTWFDGTHAVPLELGTLRLQSVHGDRALASVDADGDVRQLYRLPSGEPIPLALPADAGTVVTVGIGVDGTTFAGTRGTDDTIEVWVGAPGAWASLPYPEGMESLEVVDARHAIADTQSGLRFSNDAGATWSEPHRSLGPVRCGPGGCAIPGGSWRSPTLRRVERVVTPPGAPSSVHWPELALQHWYCAPPDATRVAPRSGVRRVSAPWSTVTFAGAASTGARVTWSGLDARGVFQASGIAPATEYDWDRLVAGTRAYAIVARGASLALVTQRRSEPLSIETPHGGWAHGGPLPDGRSVILLRNAESLEIDAWRAVVIDRTGHPSAQRDYVFRDAIGTTIAYASGPEGAVGLALRVLPDDTHWRVYPVDGSAPVTLDATMTSAAPCVGPQPWTLVIDDLEYDPTIPVQMELGNSVTGRNVVLGIGDAGACVMALSTGAGDERALVAWSARGRVQGAAIGDGPRGTAMTCTTSPPPPAQSDDASGDRTEREETEIPAGLREQIEAQLRAQGGE